MPPKAKRRRISAEESEKKKKVASPESPAESDHEEEAQNEEPTTAANPPVLSRQQRRRLRKRGTKSQLLGLKAPEQTTIVDAQPEQKQRDCNEQKQGKSLMQLEELNDAIGDLQQSVKEDLKRGKPLRMTEANRKRAMMKEISQLSQVFQHTAFQQDPVAAIQQHLQAKVRMEQQHEEALAKLETAEPKAKKVVAKKKVKATILKKKDPRASARKQKNDKNRTLGKRKRD